MPIRRSDVQHIFIHLYIYFSTGFVADSSFHVLRLCCSQLFSKLLDVLVRCFAAAACDEMLEGALLVCLVDYLCKLNFPGTLLSSQQIL